MGVFQDIGRYATQVLPSAPNPAFFKTNNNPGQILPSAPSTAPGEYDPSGSYVPLTMATGAHAAADTTAAILRGNYDNWKNTYYPKLQEMINQTTYSNPGIVGLETAAATNQVTAAYDTAKTGVQNTMARYGLSVDPATNTATDLAQTAATVGAQNQTRQYLADRDRSIVAGTPRAVSSTT